MSEKTQEGLDNLIVEGLNAEKGELDLRERELDDDDIKLIVNSDKIKIQKTAEIEGILTQKILSIEEGAVLKIKTETYK